MRVSYIFLFMILLLGVVSAQNVSKEQALQEIDSCKEIIHEMQNANFSITYVNDSLIEAEKIIEEMGYVEIINGNYSESYKKEARKFLSFIDWKNLSYSNVLVYTENIRERKKEAYEIYDLLVTLKMSIDENARNFNVSESRVLLENANEAFYNDRYGEARSFIDQSNAKLEEQAISSGTMSALTKNVQNFVRRNWIYILIAVILIAFLIIILYRILRKFYIKKNIKKMKYEIKVLNELIKKTQEERFKENKLSDWVYNIRIKKYEEKLNELNERLPAVEKSLQNR